MSSGPRVRVLGRLPYGDAFEAMRAFTATRDAATPDELWRVEHDAVFTLGLAGRPGHLLATTGVPVVKSDRGGQVTYHGPGQVVEYLMLDLRRRGLMVREAVRRIEQAVIDFLARHGLEGRRVQGAPGVYVAVADVASPPPFDGLAKIAALGLKVSRGSTYHGIALNVDMDLGAFDAIDPCGYPRLAVTDLARCGVTLSFDAAAEGLEQELLRQFP